VKPGDELDHLVRPQLEQAGFSTVFTRSSSEALDAFISGIALVLLRRRNRLDDNSFLDPFIFCKVTIKTRENGRRILYTKAYFVSTERAFGTSTPAQKSLPSGPYMFGMRVGSVTRYEQDVWDIDENIEFDLEVP
jgi:hypothetical protein